MYEYKITLNDDDYLEFNQYFLLNNRSGKRLFTFFRYIIPLLCLLIVVILFFAGAKLQSILIESITMAVLSVLWIIISKKVFLLSLKIGMKRLKNEGKLPYSREATLKFEDDCIHEITPTSENKTLYSSIDKVAEAKNAIYIIGSVQAYILPLAVFFEEAQKQKFLEFLNRMVYTSKTTK